MKLDKDPAYIAAEKNLHSCYSAMRKIEIEVSEIGPYVYSAERAKLKPGESVDQLMERMDRFNTGSIEKLNTKHGVLTNSLLSLKNARFIAEREFNYKLGKTKQKSYDKIAKVIAESYINLQQALIDQAKLSHELEVAGGSLAGLKKHFWLDVDGCFPNDGSQYQLDFYRGLFESGLMKKDDISQELKNKFPSVFPQRPELTV